MNTPNQLHFSIPPPPPRFLSKRTINADPDPPARTNSPFLEPKLAHFDSDRKLRANDSLPRFDDDLCRLRAPESDSHSRNPFAPFDTRRLKHENSWLERISSHKPSWPLPDSERKLRRSEVQESVLAEKADDLVKRGRVGPYFSDRDLMRVGAERGQGRFRLETLDDELLKREGMRHVSMRMICKRGFDQFSGRVGENKPRPLESMKIIDEKFCQFSFKSRQSYSRSRVGEDPRGCNFSPFPLSRINQPVAPQPEEEDFLNKLGKGAFKQVLTRDPMTKAGTGSDARIQRNSALSSPFEYNGAYGTMGNRPFFADLSRPPALRLKARDSVQAVSNRFNSHRKIPIMVSRQRHDTHSWRDIARPWGGEQARVWSNRRIPVTGEMRNREGSGQKAKLSENKSYRTSKRDLLEIETKYINQDGPEDKLVIEEKPHEREDLSCDDVRAPDLPLFQNLSELQPPVQNSRGMARVVNKNNLENSSHVNVQNPPKFDVIERVAIKPTKNGHQELPEPDAIANEDENFTSLEKVPLEEKPETPSEKFQTEDNEELNKSEQLSKIKANLDDSLRNFDTEREFAEFHNLLGLLSCLFVTGRVEKRYLDLTTDERGILAAIVYRKFKKKLNPE